jgi:lactoylglutathione lyase
MKIEHIALWTRDLERLRAFYEKYFDARSNTRYVNAGKQFESYFLSFPQGPRLEIMASPHSQQRQGNIPMTGYAHIAFSVGSREQVDTLTRQLLEAGSPLLDGPRMTGDGYYESVILDPDGNRIEITV